MVHEIDRTVALSPSTNIYINMPKDNRITSDSR